MSKLTRGGEPEFNPYAPPRTEAAAPTRYYRVVHSRLTYAECWRLAPNMLSFMLLVLVKTLGARTRAHAATKYPDRLDLIDFDEIPADARQRWRPALDHCPGLGLRMKLCQRVAVLGRAAEHLVMLLVRDDGQWTVTLTYERVFIGNKDRTTVTVNVASRVADGRRACTTDNRNAIAPLPDIVLQSLPGRSLPALAERHRDWLVANGWTIVPVPDENMERTILAREQAAFDQGIERGLYVPITEHEYAALARRSQNELPAIARGDRMLAVVENSLWIAIAFVGVVVLMQGGPVGIVPWPWSPDLSGVFCALVAAVALVKVVRRLRAWGRS
jgi:hypothetical protein